MIACTTLAFGRPVPALAATAPDAHVGTASGSTDHWQKVELSLGQGALGGISQITVAIETKGQRLSDRIRIPGGIASNFAIAHGKAIVDLINVGSAQAGHAAITAVEIQFDEAATDQPFTITTIAYQMR